MYRKGGEQFIGIGRFYSFDEIIKLRERRASVFTRAIRIDVAYTGLSLSIVSRDVSDGERFCGCRIPELGCASGRN